MTTAIIQSSILFTIECETSCISKNIAYKVDKNTQFLSDVAIYDSDFGSDISTPL